MFVLKSKIISPGQGSSGYYPAQTLQAAAAKNIFPKGTQVFWVDNKTHGSGVEDPERLAGVLEGNAVWEEQGLDGPGLYAPIRIFSDYESRVREKGPNLGLSIVAIGEFSRGLLPSGLEGEVISDIIASQSVDVVTKAGRGGKFLFESDTSRDVRVLLEGVHTCEEETAPEPEQVTQPVAKSVTLSEAEILTARVKNLEEALYQERVKTSALIASGLISRFLEECAQTVSEETTNFSSTISRLFSEKELVDTERLKEALKVIRPLIQAPRPVQSPAPVKVTDNPSPKGTGHNSLAAEFQKRYPSLSLEQVQTLLN